MIISQPSYAESNLDELRKFPSLYGHQVLKTKQFQRKIQSTADIGYANLGLYNDSYLDEQANDLFMHKHYSTKELIDYKKSRTTFFKNDLSSNSSYKIEIPSNKNVSLLDKYQVYLMSSVY